MKTATAFIVAVTVFASVFLESSAAPNPHIGDLIEKAGGVVSEAIEVTGDTLTVFGNKAAEDIKTVKQVAGKILEGLEATFQAVIEAAAALGGEIGEKLKEASIRLQRDSKELIILNKKIVKAVAEGAEGTVKELEGLIENLVQKLKADVAGIIQILDLIPEKAGKNVSFVIDIVTGSLVKVEKLIEDILSNLAEVLKSKTTKVVNGAKKLDESNLEEYFEKKIKNSEEALSALDDFIEGYLAKVSDEDKKKVSKVIEWVKNFGAMAYGIHEELREACKVNDLEKFKKVLEKILEAIKNANVQMNEFKKTQVDEINEAMHTYIMKNVVLQAKDVVEILRKIIVKSNKAPDE